MEKTFPFDHHLRNKRFGSPPRIGEIVEGDRGFTIQSILRTNHAVPKPKDSGGKFYGDEKLSVRPVKQRPGCSDTHGHVWVQKLRQEVIPNEPLVLPSHKASRPLERRGIFLFHFGYAAA